MLDCFYSIAEFYSVPEPILTAVYVTEGGSVGQKVGPNSNGTFDLGPMQINSWWWDDHPRSLSKLGITQESVLNDFCQNVAVGAYILNQNYSAYGNWADAITAYNKGKPTEGVDDYLKKVLDNL